MLDGRGNDQLHRKDRRDRLVGWLGDDTLNAGNGNDRPGGFLGDDALDGGDATDLCVTGPRDDTTLNCER